MPIQVICQACRFTLEIPDEFAGKKAKCGNCGEPFRVPGGPAAGPVANAPPPLKRLLGEASLLEIWNELRRRGLQGLLTSIDLPKYNVRSLADLLESGEPLNKGLQLETTEPLNVDQTRRLLELIGDGLSRMADPTSAAEQDSYYDPFSFKGDPLGMTLSEFKSKYARTVPGSPNPAPFCSDQGGGFPVPDLLTEAWHHHAGIVHARIEYPVENRPPTFAGVEAELLLYQFLDGRLFQVVALFGSEKFPHVAATLRNKYGEAAQENQEPRQLIWKRLASSLELTKGRISPRTPSQLRVYFDDLVAEASSRRPSHGGDI